MNTDVLVIGSGYGGSVVAARSAQAGLRVHVLERGAALTPADWDAIADGRSPLHRGRFANGPLDIHVQRGLGALTGNAAGGGSRINTAVTIRPRAHIFDSGWPTGVNLDTLGPCYDRVEAEIRPTKCPTESPRIQFMNRMGAALGIEVSTLPLAFDWSRVPKSHGNGTSSQSFAAELTNWLRSVGGARRGLNQTYLRIAELAGAIIETDASVEVIEPTPGGFRVHFQHRGVGSALTSRQVILAAGTLNTLRLLFANRDEQCTLPNVSQCLGRRFFTNGDRGALLFGADHDWESDFAPPALAWFDQWDAHRFFAMDLGPAPIARGQLGRLLALAARSGTGRNGFGRTTARGICGAAWIIGIMGASETPRTVTHRGDGRMSISADVPTRSHRNDPVTSCIAALAGAAGARWMIVPDFLERRMPMTVHPLGGAAMADSPNGGVTDPHGEVFGHPRLFVADGALLPTATGVPPSMTIAALAERVAMRVVEAAR